MSDGSDSLNLDAVALFALPNVVLLPRAVLPLHIFEFRYQIMTADALQSGKLVAMALLKPGWEKDYYGRTAVEPVVCVGYISSWEQLPDGKYNFLLQGIARATIEKEHTDRPYRYASLARLRETKVFEIDLGRERDRLRELFASPPLNQLPVAGQFLQFLAGPLATADVADLVAFHFIDQVSLKQSFLADGDVGARVRRIVAALEANRPFTAMLQKDDSAKWN